MHLGRLHVWGITASMFPPPHVGRQVDICIYGTPMFEVSRHVCFLHRWGDKSMYAFMPPPCVGYHSIYVSSMCGETSPHMRVCHLHVWGITASTLSSYVWGDKSTYAFMPPLVMCGKAVAHPHVRMGPTSRMQEAEQHKVHVPLAKKNNKNMLCPSRTSSLKDDTRWIQVRYMCKYVSM